MRYLLLILALVTVAEASTPPTVPVTLLFEGPGEQEISGTPQLRIKPHVAFRITDDSGDYWTIPAYWQTFDVTSTVGDQILNMHPNKPGASSYTISPETYYDYEFIDATGSYRGRVQVTYGGAVQWGEIHLDDDVDSTSAYLLPTDVLAGNNVSVGVEGGSVRITASAEGFVTQVMPGPNVAIGGTTTYPIVMADSSTITPSIGNLQGSFAGDLAGTSSNTTVDGLEGYDMTYPSVPPSDGHVWAWDYATQAFVLEAQSGSGGIATLEPGIATTIGPAPNQPNVDSASVTPTWSNIQGAPGLSVGYGVVVGPAPWQPNVDSSAITPTWANVQSKPNVVEGIDSGVAVQIGGTSTRPAVSVDSATITPTWANIQDAPGLTTGYGIIVGPGPWQPNVDSTAITPTWANVQGKPNVIEGIDAGVATQVGGTSTRPVVNVDSSAITPTYGNLQGGLAAGIATQISGTSNAPQVNVDSSAITPTYSNLQGVPSTFAPSAHGSIHADGADNLPVDQGLEIANGRVRAKAGTGIYIGADHALYTDSTSVTRTITGNVTASSDQASSDGTTSGSLGYAPIDHSHESLIVARTGSGGNLGHVDTIERENATRTGTVMTLPTLGVSGSQVSIDKIPGSETVTVTPTTYLDSDGQVRAQTDHVIAGSNITFRPDSTGALIIDGAAGGGGSLTGQLAGASDTTIDTLNTSIDGQLEAIIVGDTMTISGTSGKVVQHEFSPYTEVATTTSIIPADDTKPQITEGSQAMTVSITPRKIGNILYVFASCWGSTNSGTQTVYAMFISTSSDAVAAKETASSTADYKYDLSLKYRHVVTQAGEHTFTVRYGPRGAATSTFNGAGGARNFGAINKSWIEVVEVSP